MESITRQKAAQAVTDAFILQDFQWGERDCLKLALAAVEAAGLAVPDLPKYSTELGAAKALKKADHADLVAAIDSLGFARVAPMAAWPCDIIAIEGDETVLGGWTLGMAIGGNRALSFVAHADRHFCDELDLFDLGVNAVKAGKTVLAWRVA